MQNIAFLKNQLFPKWSFSEKVDAVQKYLLWKGSSKNIAVPNSNCRKELTILKKWILVGFLQLHFLFVG